MLIGILWTEFLMTQPLFVRCYESVKTVIDYDVADR